MKGILALSSSRGRMFIVSAILLLLAAEISVARAFQRDDRDDEGRGREDAEYEIDSHYFRGDRPMLSSTGVRLENFTRVETFGDNANAVTQTNDVQWLKVMVDPKSREVFAYQAQIVPANRVAVPAP